ncbi:hypothetical protein SteCoe_9833 [Stentor coeruleus]|uniref:Uncharacterized protein n=1 Tax=Stentor coeruleus TaxID=5963 RepID=A0A1R2CH05_9CILI|nr:hypothetical protein SteCoe_9833 [Stentor coeruleus]
MGESIHLYKLLESSEDRIPVQIPDTIIYGFGFIEPTLITYSTSLNFSSLSEESALVTLENMLKKNTILQKSQAGIKEICEVYEIPKKISQEIVYQSKIVGKRCKVLWTCTCGYSCVEQPAKLRIQFEFIKSLINKKILFGINARLSRLEVEFIVTVKGQVYCLAITEYAFSEVKSLSSFHSLDTTSIQKTISKTPVQLIKPLNKSKTPSIKPEPKPNRVIGDHFSDLMQSSESTKYMRYTQWKRAIESGKRLLSNELLYSKKLAGISTRVLVQSTKNVKEMRRMAGIMRRNLHKRESFVDPTEIAKLRENMLIENYMIDLNNEKEIKEKRQKNLRKTVKFILDDASLKLDTMTNRNPLTRQICNKNF